MLIDMSKVRSQNFNVVMSFMYSLAEMAIVRVSLELGGQ